MKRMKTLTIKQTGLLMQILAGVVIVGEVGGMVVELAMGKTVQEMGEHLLSRDVLLIFEGLFLVSCVGVIARRSWAYHLMRVAGCWLLALNASSIGVMVTKLISPILPDIYRFRVGSLSYVISVVFLLSMGFMVVMVLGSHKLVESQKDILNDSEGGIEGAEAVTKG